MITLNPAWQLGVDKRVGSIEPGKDADIAIFSAHPFSPRRARRDDAGGRASCYFDRAQGRRARADRGGGGRCAMKTRSLRASALASLTAAGARRRGRAASVAIRGGAHRHRLRSRHRERARSSSSGGKIAAVGADVGGPAGADGHRRRGQDRLPGPHRRAHHARPDRDRQRAGLGGHDGDRRRQPAGAGLGRRAPAQRAHPGRARERHHRRARPRPRAASSPARARSSAWPGSTPDALTVKAAGRRCTWSTRPAAPPSTSRASSRSRS